MSDVVRTAVETVDRLVTTSDRPQSPAIIFGGRNKLRPDGPYLELLAQFEAQLTQFNRLLVVGYSFRDAHINEVIRRWINRAPDRRIVVVDPIGQPRFFHPESFASELTQRLRGSHEVTQPNGALYRPGLARRINYVANGAAAGLSKGIDMLRSDEDALWGVPDRPKR